MWRPHSCSGTFPHSPSPPARCQDCSGPPAERPPRDRSILTHSDTFDEDVDRAVLRFTDATAEDLRKAAASGGPASSAFARAAGEFSSFQHEQLLQNIDLRLLEDVLSPAPGGYFLAALRGTKDRHLFLTVDPHGAPKVAPEQVSLVTFTSWGEEFLTAFSPADASGQEAFRIDHEELDTTIEKNGFLTGIATVHLIARQNGVAVAPLVLYPTLRVSRAVTDSGQPLDFVQEKKDQDADFGVVLAKPLAQGEAATIRIEYAGKDVVKNEGGQNYYPVARQSWYPSAGSELGDYSTYQMTFHVPRDLQLIATGTKTSDKTDGKTTTTEWKTDVPLPVVGFNLGEFKEKDGTLKWKTGQTLAIEAYANPTPPDEFASLFANQSDPRMAGGETGPALGGFYPPKMLPLELGQAQVAAELYSRYYGPIPFDRIAITQQFACNYGQSWPMLVYLPICGFLDQTQQHFLGLEPEDMYWKTVTPHEVAHQWWGQTVGFGSYRDQWMSEGFADASAAIFLQATRPKPDDYLDFWKQQQQILTRKNEMGFRPIDVGPVTMGFRLSSNKTGWSVYQDLVYPKGAFILHMIRMMMWSRKDGDQPYIDMMHDFLSTYRLKVATTEDFRAMVEKHMTPATDLEGNHRMDWFFREYVYGTDLPVYHFEGNATPDENGWKLHVLLKQSGVEPSFVNSVPIYLRLASGNVFRLGSFRITGSHTEEQTIQLPKMPSGIKEVLINYNYDVLCAYD